jgi:cytochrome c oxidase assembly protein subunit 15
MESHTGLPATKTQTGLFRTFGIATVFSVFFLILVGGIVRSTGSGMGCPDWPKCFGTWIPPTQVEQLPMDYQERFSTVNHSVAEFSVFKTWTEYLNRLLGVLVGILIFITLILSLRFRRERPVVTILSFAAFILVAFVGWLGAKVVASNLMPGMITMHMLGAILVTGCLIFAVSYAKSPELSALRPGSMTGIRAYWTVCISLAFMQLILGTQVREAIDIVAKELNDSQRELWIDRMPLVFYIHRSASLAFLVISFLLHYRIRGASSDSNSVLKASNIHLIVTFIAIALGIVLAYLDMPAFAQPLHLLMGSMVCFTSLYLGTLIFPDFAIVGRGKTHSA